MKKAQEEISKSERGNSKIELKFWGVMKTNYLFIFRLKICFEKEADFLYRIRAATITTLRCIVDFTLFLRFTGGEFRGGLKKVIQHVNED